MDLHRTPTLNDLAKMLDSIPADLSGAYPETLHVLRWLIESSPTACEIHDRLHARRADSPSLIELARLIIATEHGEPYPEAVYTAHWLIERSTTGAELYRRLERMAADAGLGEDRDPNWATEAFVVREELDRLLATLDDWQDAAEAIELKMLKCLAFERLLNVCRARIARGDTGCDERSRLERLRRRLQAAARRARNIPDAETKLNALQDSLRSLANPAAALETVEGLIHRQRDEDSGPDPGMNDNP